MEILDGEDSSLEIMLMWFEWIVFVQKRFEGDKINVNVCVLNTGFALGI